MVKTKTRSKEITILINRLNSGGAEKVCVVLCNELVKRGYNVSIWIVKYENTSLASKLDKKVQISSLNKERVSHCIMPLINLFVKNKPKVILIFNTELSLWAILIKIFLLNKPLIILRNINTLSMELNSPNYWKKYIVYPLIKNLIKRSDIIVAQSEGMKKDLIENYNITEKKIKTIPNPAVVLGNQFSDRVVINKKNELVFIGRLVEQKGLILLLEAISIASRSVEDLHLTIVGEGPQLESLQKLASDLSITKFISFVGFQANVNSYIIDAKATVLTSYYEGFPNVLVESISLGTPVISFDCPSGPKDIIEPYVNGVLVPYLNVELFAQAIIDVLNGEYKFDEKAVVASSERFSLKSIADKYEQLFI